MTKTLTIAPVRKTLVVNAALAHAFDVFTSRLDSWWPKSHNLGNSPLVKSLIEPKLGGRWYTTHEDGSECVIGHIRVLDPPHRLVFSWEVNSDWKCDASVASEVEVTFVAEDSRRTRVLLEHRNFESLGQVGGEKMRDGVDGGWVGILDQFKNQAEL